MKPVIDPMSKPYLETLKTFYGMTADGVEVSVYTLEAGPYKVKVLDYGAILLEWWLGDHNVILTQPSLADYESNPAYIGCVVGRYGGRLKEALLLLPNADDSVNVHPLTANDRSSCLHGGTIGFGRRLWQVELRSRHEIVMTYHSAEGEEGFPGNLWATVSYTLNDAGELAVTFEGKSDQLTAFAPTQHVYFNLDQTIDMASGSQKKRMKDILDHTLHVNTSGVLQTGKDSVPEVMIRDREIIEAFLADDDAVVAEMTAADMETLETLGREPLTVSALNALWSVFFNDDKGLDNPFEIDNPQCAVLTSKAGKRKLTVMTDCPYVVVYSGGWLNDSIRLLAYPDGPATPAIEVSAMPHQGICFETQEMPNGPALMGRGPWLVSPESPYKRTTVYRLTALEEE